MEMQDIKSSGGDMSPQTRERVMQIFNDVIQDKEANYPQTLARRLKEQCDIQMKVASVPKTEVREDEPASGMEQPMDQTLLKNIGGEMLPTYREKVIGIVTQCIQNNPSEANYPQNLCRLIKEACDTDLKGTWNCHVGPSFGSSFPYEKNAYFTAMWKDLSIVLYKYH